ncbi:hypothetical protein DL765_004145 [Monosporascus sp. GIB2]|nr:hypothetical protein DL765_004145 [Monosporascus sp. GIB2]
MKQPILAAACTALGLRSTSFCEEADGQTVGPDGYLSLATEVFLNGRKDTKKYGLLGYAYSKVLSKQGSGHIVESAADGRHAQQALRRRRDIQAADEQGSGAPLDLWPLDLWPLDSLGGVTPAACHSHGDYERDVPLFSALAAGCLAVEADAHLMGDDLEIGRNRPARGRTCGSNTSSHCAAILDNSGVASGSAPFDRIASGDGIPSADVFYDADKDLSRKPSLEETIRKQAAEAHMIGLKVRNYSSLRESEWEKLIELGADMLDADDMSNAARLLRIQ